MNGRAWLGWELRALRRSYLWRDAREIAEMLGRSISGVYEHARAIGLRKPDYVKVARNRQNGAHLAVIGAAYRFPRGHAPANKGKRRPGWSTGRMRETQFKKGQLPHTWLPIGAYRTSSDGYLQQKVSDTGYQRRDWVGVHRLVWERAHGPIPPGHVVRFLPGRRTTDLARITADSLECITLRENMLRNSVHNLPEPIVHVVRLRATLVRAINKRSKGDEEQDR